MRRIRELPPATMPQIAPVPPFLGWVEFVANAGGGGPPPTPNFLLQEDGFYLLQEDGSKLIVT